MSEVPLSAPPTILRTTVGLQIGLLWGVLTMPASAERSQGLVRWRRAPRFVTRNVDGDFSVHVLINETFIVGLTFEAYHRRVCTAHDLSAESFKDLFACGGRPAH